MGLIVAHCDQSTRPVVVPWTMPPGEDEQQTPGALHHVELWVPDLRSAVESWGWLLERLGYRPYQEWPRGRSWTLGPTYIVLEESSALITDVPFDRCRPGLNHLAFHAASRLAVDAIVDDAPRHGWILLFPDRHPFAGGPDYYAAYLEDATGFEVEIVVPAQHR